MVDKVIGDFDAWPHGPVLGTDLIGASRDGQYTYRLQLTDLVAWTGTVQTASELALAATIVARDLTFGYRNETSAFADIAELAKIAAAASALAASGSASTAGGLASSASASAAAAALDKAAAAASALAASGSATTANGSAVASAANAAAALASQIAAALSETNSSANALAAAADRVLAVAAKIAAENAADLTAADVITTAANAAATAGYAATARRTGIFLGFDSSTTDGDPGPGLFRMNNVTVSSVTKLFTDLLDKTGGDITAWLATFDDSDNSTNRGQVTFIDTSNSAVWAIFIVSNANDEPAGYRKINVTYVAHQGTFVAGHEFILQFTRTGNKGVDGLGAGDVIGPAGGVTDGDAVLWDTATGKLIKSAGWAPQRAGANLEAIRGLTSAANKLPYFTGSGAASVTDFVADARTLVGHSFAQMRTDLSINNVDNTSDATKWGATATLTNKTFDLGGTGNIFTGTLAQFNAACSDADFASIAYVNGLVTGLWDDRGSYDASGNVFPSTGGSGSAGAILKGDIWTISVAGTLGGVAVGIGDTLRAVIDTPGSTLANWAITEGNLGYVPLNKASNLSDLASAPTARVSLGLVIGTDVQAYDATLEAFRLLTIAANSLSIGSGADAFTQVTFAANTFPGRGSTGNLVAKTISDNGLSLLAAADYSAMRTALSLVPGTNVQAYDADLATIAGLTATTDSFMQAKSGAWSARTIAQVVTDLQGTGSAADAAGFRGIPSDSVSADYTFVMADNGRQKKHPSADTTARVWTIPANSATALPIGAAITGFNQNAAGVLTIAITTDTLRLAGAGTTGSRSVAANGLFTLLKVDTTEWVISGSGVT